MLAQGFPGTNSKRHTQYPEASPSYCAGHGSGPYLFDAFGRKYLDFPSALGALILGYTNTRVIEAVQRQAFKGCSFTLPTTLELEVAEHVAALIPVAQKTRFLKTGGEATSAAIRIARTYTNRPLILSQGYHGHGDLWTSLTEPALGIKDDFKIINLPAWADPSKLLDPDSLEQAAPPEKTAAIIVEALQLEMTDQWQSYLRSLREYCTRHGIVLIFDEIITGFRVPNYSVSGMWGIEPDLICLGKAIANGYPLAVVAGKSELMDCAEYFISSTFSGEAISLAACQATLRELESSARSLKDLQFYGQRLQDKLNMLDPEIRFEGYGTRAMLNVTNPKTSLFVQEMAKAGILLGKAHFFHFAHLQENVEAFVMNVADGVMQQIKDGKVKPEGRQPTETFKR